MLSSSSWGTRGQMGYIIPPSCSGSVLGLPPSWRCLKKPPRGGNLEASWRHPNQMPKQPQLTRFDVEEERRLYSELPLGGPAPHPTSKAESSHLPKETYFSCLHPRPHTTQIWPWVRTTKSKASPFGSTLSLLLIKRQSVSLQLGIIHEQDPEILEAETHSWLGGSTPHYSGWKLSQDSCDHQ